MTSKSPSSRWTSEHGYGHGSSGRRHFRLLKIAYGKESDARDEALLMDLRYGMPMQTYPCRWGADYRDGETSPLHWHVGRAPE